MDGGTDCSSPEEVPGASRARRQQTGATSAALKKYSKERRKKLRDAGICINGSLGAMTPHPKAKGKITHGPPVTKSGKCQRCKDVHKKSR